MTWSTMFKAALLPAALAFAFGAFAQPVPTVDPLASSMAKLETELVATHGENVRPSLQRGMRQVASLWKPEDGDAATFENFVRQNFAGDAGTREELFNRLEAMFEQLDGHMLEIIREFRMQTDVELGPVLPVDHLFAGYNPSAHVTDDFFANKIAFVVLLNFPLTTLDERLAQGDSWTRREWAEARLGQRFSRRVPAEVNQEISRVSSAADNYINGYNIWMHHLLDEKGTRLFPAKMRLISHWNLRDEIRANFAVPDAIEKQRMIQQVMERIVTQTIPQVVIDNPTVDWKPYSNTVAPAAVSDSDRAPSPAAAVTNTREPDTRYEHLLNQFNAVRKADPYSPAAPTLIARRFDENREIPEERVRAIFEQVLTSPLVPQVAALIQKRLGRPLEPFDIWYNGFRSSGAYTEAELDPIVRKKYPNAEAYRADIPNMLVSLGFSEERAAVIADNIVVHPSRGIGHAFGAATRDEKAYLRTRVEKDGMNYKGYNIAVHEMGHNVEQTISLNEIDHTMLEGVPNTAFTEALAFVFQARDLELLGLAKPDARSRALATLGTFWGTYEIAGVALVDMNVWRWMYDNPDATPAQLRDATVQISRDIWNRYYAPVFGKRDVVLLGIYSHMIDAMLYLPDYPLGHLIAFQIEQQMERAGSVGPEFERMAKQGNLAPDIWMKNATGAPVGPEALLTATGTALKTVAQ
ncbi:MAG TPA: hypothetical protein VMS12_03330 [Thermoanaerobaculia bacterium]|nr:hypothetical protein [Thermoanaerobaculia bacterium]